MKIREDWLAAVEEEVLEPDRRIIDPHHHFFAPRRRFPAYDLDDLWSDTASHRVEQTVFLQCWEGYRKDGPEAFRPVGETEWVESIAERATARPERSQIGGIVGSVELRGGDDVRPVLEAHLAASERFRGIRQPAAWDPDPSIISIPGVDDPHLYDDAAFRAGFAVLHELDLVYDAYHYHTQNGSLTRLARDFPDVSIVLDHLGTPLGIGPYAGRAPEIFEAWTKDLADLARCPNVAVKLGGLCMPWNGFHFEERPRPPTSDELVAAQDRYYRFAIDTFGPQRCMFESNFPVDKCALSYTILWNAFKKMAAGYSEAEKDALFYGTAARVYRLE